MPTETHNQLQSFNVSARFGAERAPKAGEAAAFRWRDCDHTPWTKKRGEVEAVASLILCDEPKNGWVEIQLTEQTTDKLGRVHSRTIAVTLNSDARKALLAYLKKSGA